MGRSVHVQQVKDAKASMKSYSRCLRCTGLCGFILLGSLTAFQAALIGPSFPALSADTSWVQTGDAEIDKVIREVLSSDEAYYVGNETVLSNYQATVGDGQPPHNFIDYGGAQTSFHVFLQLGAQGLLLLALVNMCLAGQVSATLLSQDRLRADQVHGARDGDDDNETRPINPRATQPSARQRRRLARLPASNTYHQGTVVTFRNLFLFLVAAAIGVELFRWQTVYRAMQAELELRYDDEYFIWRDVFVNGVEPEQALADNAERKADPDNQETPSTEEGSEEASTPARTRPSGPKSGKAATVAGKAPEKKAAAAGQKEPAQEAPEEGGEPAEEPATPGKEKKHKRERKPPHQGPKPEDDFEKVVNENQRGFIAKTPNADRFFKFHTKYGALNVAPRVVAGLCFALLSLRLLSSYRRHLAFYERNRLTEDHWGNAP